MALGFSLNSYEIYGMVAQFSWVKGVYGTRNSFFYYREKSSPINEDKERESERALAENAALNALLWLGEFSQARWLNHYPTQWLLLRNCSSRNEKRLGKMYHVIEKNVWKYRLTNRRGVHSLYRSGWNYSRQRIEKIRHNIGHAAVIVRESININIQRATLPPG